jgi:hypothetical protein
MRILITPLVSISSSYYSQLYEYLPTMSRDGPVALEFQLYENCDGQLVYPSACLVVNNNKLYQTMRASQVLMEIMGMRTHSLNDDNS